MATKKSVTLSVDADIDNFMDEFRTKVVNIQNKEIKFTRTKNELYLEALRFSIEHADEWLFASTKEEEDEDKP